MELQPPPPGDFESHSKTKVTPTMAIILVCLMSSFVFMCCVSIYARHLVERRLAAAATSTTLESHGVGSGRHSTPPSSIPSPHFSTPRSRRSKRTACR
ncbi:E3 ubiquitin-protein like [Actinidia chinensis var. chinensis]|uniref:E3 ubiquitin-protein like n=1 Tax=Actinidia chinensis var. chinensis TaxID=1590841 RepID=A0A2R6R2Z8_ACTCC|nr:E3 ubiquitin-protein like [Actinidia chinensis var. chinensis]